MWESLHKSKKTNTTRESCGGGVANAADAATGVTYGTDNPFGNGIGSATPFGIGTDTPQGIFATDTHTFNPLAALNPTQTFAQAQALAIPTIPVSPASFLQGVPSKIL